LKARHAGIAVWLTDQEAKIDPFGEDVPEHRNSEQREKPKRHPPGCQRQRRRSNWHSLFSFIGFPANHGHSLSTQVNHVTAGQKAQRHIWYVGKFAGSPVLDCLHEEGKGGPEGKEQQLYALRAEIEFAFGRSAV